MREEMKAKKELIRQWVQSRGISPKEAKALEKRWLARYRKELAGKKGIRNEI